jgi:hypothetical protein
MPATTALDLVPLWLVFAATTLGMLLCVEIGHRAGQWRRTRPSKEVDAPVGGLVAAELGLLAFLLAITFNIAANRFEDRRNVLLDESNAIGTTWLRAAMLPDPHQSEVRRLLREYVDIRIAAARTTTPIQAATRRSEEIHTQLWAHATAAATADPRSIPAGLFTQALNDTIDLHAKRVQAALRSRLPAPVWAVLFAVAALSFGMIGYQGGLAGTTRSPAIVVVALAFAAVIWLAVDLERPHAGLLRVSQQPLIDLRNAMTPTTATTRP